MITHNEFMKEVAFEVEEKQNLARRTHRALLADEIKPKVEINKEVVKARHNPQSKTSKANSQISYDAIVGKDRVIGTETIQAKFLGKRL